MVSQLAGSFAWPIDVMCPRDRTSETNHQPELCSLPLLFSPSFLALLIHRHEKLVRKKGKMKDIAIEKEAKIQLQTEKGNLCNQMTSPPKATL